MIAIIGGGVVVVLFVVWLGFSYALRSGRAAAELERYRTTVKHASRANEIDEDVRRLSDDELDRELRDSK